MYPTNYTSEDLTAYISDQQYVTWTEATAVLVTW
jgi:hypothetical protein